MHLVPEGGRTRDIGARIKTPFKPGIGKLIADAQPVVLPFFHLGMEAVLPVGARVPGHGHTVTVHFGEPTVFDRARVQSLGGTLEGRPQIAAITEWTQRELIDMERRYRRC